MIVTLGWTRTYDFGLAVQSGKRVFKVAIPRSVPILEGGDGTGCDVMFGLIVPRVDDAVRHQSLVWLRCGRLGRTADY